MKNKVFILFFLIVVPLFSCSIFDTKSADNMVLVGRNFDWSKDNGQINFINATTNKNGLVLVSLKNPNMPYEGMNDKGLFIAVTAVPNTDTTVNILKPIRKSLEMIKLVLERSSNIDQSIELFNKYSIAFGQFLGNPLVHYKIVQKDGKGIIIEFVNNKMVIVKNRSNIMTNHYLSDLNIKSDSKTTKKRYDSISKYLKNSTNTVRSVFEGLYKVKQENTVWSNVYNLTTQEIYVKYKNNKIVKFNLKDELYNNKNHLYKMQKISTKQKLPKKSSSIQIRPHFGYGTSKTKHAGIRVLLSSNKKQSYGIEITDFKNSDNNFTSIGLILEQRKWDWFQMSIGTVGYFNYGVDDENIVGLVSNFGWEPNNSIPFKPFITVRKDVIFAKETKIIGSISFGMKMEF
jgi:penicillin V acylase-like amidase (Ntn superfamily)